MYSLCRGISPRFAELTTKSLLTLPWYPRSARRAQLLPWLLAAMSSALKTLHINVNQRFYLLVQLISFAISLRGPRLRVRILNS